MYIRIKMCKYIHVCMYIYIYVRLQLYIYIYIHIHVCGVIYIYIYTWMYFKKMLNIHTNESVDFPTYLCTIYLYIQIMLYTNTQMFTHNRAENH